MSVLGLGLCFSWPHLHFSKRHFRVWASQGQLFFFFAATERNLKEKGNIFLQKVSSLQHFTMTSSRTCLALPSVHNLWLIPLISGSCSHDKSEHVSKYCAKLGSWCSASLLIKPDRFYFFKSTWAFWIHLENSRLTWSTLLVVSCISLSWVRIQASESLWTCSIRMWHIRGFSIVIQQKNPMKPVCLTLNFLC